MDNSQQQPPAAQSPIPEPTTLQAAPQAAQVAPPQVVVGKSKGMPKIIWVLIALVLILAIGAAGWYFFMNPSKGTQTTGQTQSGVTTSDLQQELDGIKDEDVDKDFMEIDADIQTLQ